jgi:hypothetical protein
VDEDNVTDKDSEQENEQENISTTGCSKRSMTPQQHAHLITDAVAAACQT